MEEARERSLEALGRLRPPASGPAAALSIPGLRCVACHEERLRSVQEALECAGCGILYPVLGGVPVLFEDAEVERARKPGSETASRILQEFGLPDDAVMVQRVRQIFARTARYGGLLIETESAQFLDRLRNTGVALGSDVAAAARVAPWQDDLARVPRLRWTRTYLPRLLRPGTELFANVRLENAGDVLLRRDGDGRLSLATRWHDELGAPANAPDARTPLPIDLPPGSSVTVPVRLATPSAPGRYRLSLIAVQEGVRWLDDDTLTVSVQLRDDVPPEVPPGWIVRAEGPSSYQADHERGTEMLGAWLRRHAPEAPRILEVGGNAVPMIAGLHGDLYNVDVDLRGLQICALVARHARRPMGVVCADAENLPFPPGFFDAIVVFASLHHFPDPVRLLLHLGARLRPGGFIGVLCEPVGHVWPGAIEPGFLAELEKGVNEQSFSLREYEGIFRRAELDAAEVVVDRGSLKARLVPVRVAK